MSAAPTRPEWFGHVGVQVAAAAAAAWNVVQLVQHLFDGEAGEAFFNFALVVVFAYVVLESRRFRREQDRPAAAEQDGATEVVDPRDGPAA
ncbi:hypothetical protein [Modestobacter lacusdianchii]